METLDAMAIACDHGGFALKEALKVALPDVTWLDLGTHSADSVDYPDFAGKLADAIKAGNAGRGIRGCQARMKKLEEWEWKATQHFSRRT